MTDFYLFITKEHLYDVTLAGEDKHIMTHKVILFGRYGREILLKLLLKK